MNNFTYELLHVDGHVFLVVTSKLWDGEIVNNIDITDKIDSVNRERLNHLTDKLNTGNVNLNKN